MYFSEGRQIYKEWAKVVRVIGEFEGNEFNSTSVQAGDVSVKNGASCGRHRRKWGGSSCVVAEWFFGRKESAAKLLGMGRVKVPWKRVGSSWEITEKMGPEVLKNSYWLPVSRRRRRTQAGGWVGWFSAVCVWAYTEKWKEKTRFCRQIHLLLPTHSGFLKYVSFYHVRK